MKHSFSKRSQTIIFLLLTITFAIGNSEAREPNNPEPANNEFHFVVLGDSQFDDPASFNRMINDIRHLQPAFVIQVGDMIHGYTNDMNKLRGQWERFQRQINPLGSVTFVPVPGNHDLHNALRASDRRVEAVYLEKWGPTNRFFDYKNSRFIILNSDAPGKENQIGPTQWSWLEKTLATAKTEHIFVFLHRPPYSLKNSEALHTLLNQHNTKYVFYGHHHHYHYEKRDKVTYVMTNSSGDSAQQHPLAGGFDHFLQVGVRDNLISTAVIKADSIEDPNSVSPSDNYDLYKLIQHLAPSRVNLKKNADKWIMSIPLSNRTDRKLIVYAECGARDERWTKLTGRIDPITLTANNSTQLRTAWANNNSEFTPSCTLTVPYQTAQGKWIQHQSKVESTLR